MINRVTRILSRWLDAHPTYGLRALAASVTFDSTEEATALEINGDALPVTIYNDVDDECVATRYDPDVVPALVIVAQLSTDAPLLRGRGQLDFDQVKVSFAYMERDQPVSFARRRGGYLLTALMDSLNAFNEPKLSKVPIPDDIDPAPAFRDASASWRTLGDVEVLEVADLKESRVTGGVGKSTLIGSVIGTFKVRRTVPARYPQ